MGAEIIDVDELAHDLYRPRSVIWRKVFKAFGPDIVRNDKTINRAILAALVFSDRKKLKKLEKIMYPAIVKELKRQMAQAKGKIVVADMAILFEARAQKLFDKIVLVKVSKANQVKRLLKSRKLTKSQALSRIGAFKSQTGKITQSDHTIDGNLPLIRMQKQARELFRKIP